MMLHPHVNERTDVPDDGSGDEKCDDERRRVETVRDGPIKSIVIRVERRRRVVHGIFPCAVTTCADFKRVASRCS